MNIARVIVDVPASNVNQTFDYMVPERLQPILQPGMRVVIPFGPRKITGFVMERRDTSEFESLKSIIEVLDLMPVLTEELLVLGKWLAKETVSLYITTFHAMLPQVLKAKYKKMIRKETEIPLPADLEKLFQGNDTIPYEDFEVVGGSLKLLRQAVEDGDVTIQYEVKNQAKKKYKTIVIPAAIGILKEAETTISRQASRQLQLIGFFMEHHAPIDQQLLYQTLGINRGHLKPLLDKQLVKLRQEEVYRNPYEEPFPQTKNLTLTAEQATAIRPINAAIDKESNRTFLLHGVTGSGKTEIYLQSIEKVLTYGKEAIVLVPEIALTPQMVQRFKGRFGDEVAVMHSALSVGEKYDEWRKIQQKEVSVVVGARSAIFAPFENLGMIIIDEEHETTYKQEETPRYHARDVAIKRAAYNSCPVVLGSATPTLESFARAKKGVYELLTLTKRTNEKDMPAVEIADMRAELHAGNRTMFSRVLMEKMKDRLAKKEQIVLLLNRRGYSNFALCRDCGHVEECPNCDISLTYHKKHQALKCHYCAHEQPMPMNCPACNSDLIRFFGTGTERVEEALSELLPEAGVIRMDVDTTRRKGAHERLLRKFGNQEASILLGTQMIAKGLDFENVTLVGVLAADSMLHLPDFRSAEKTFQLLTQVSGRAGRHELTGEVVVQTYTPEHYSVELASQYDFMQFYEQEMRLRHSFLYPPYMFLVLFTISDEEEQKVYETASQLRQQLSGMLNRQSMMLGPSPSPVPRVKNRFRYQLMIKYRSEPRLTTVIGEVLRQLEKRNGVQITVDFNPYQLM